MEAVRCPIGQERIDEVAAMNRRPIPEDEQTAGHLAQQVFQKAMTSVELTAWSWQ